MSNESINHTFTKNPISPQDATISTYHEDNQVHYVNVKDASTTIESKKNLQHLQTLNKYINAKENSHSTMVPSHL